MPAFLKRVKIEETVEGDTAEPTSAISQYGFLPSDSDEDTYVDPDDEPFIEDGDEGVGDDEEEADESLLGNDLQPRDCEGTMDEITELLDSDILCGKKVSRQRPGNVAYNKFISHHAAAYFQATNKKIFVEGLITQLPGRCVKKVVTEDGSSLYELVPKYSLISKVTRALSQKTNISNDQKDSSIEPEMELSDEEEFRQEGGTKSLKVHVRDGESLVLPYMDDPSHLLSKEGDGNGSVGRSVISDSSDLTLMDTDILSGKHQSRHPGNTYFLSVMKESVAKWRNTDDRDDFVRNLIQNKFAKYRFVNKEREDQSQTLTVLSDADVVKRVREGLNNHTKQALKNIRLPDIQETDVFCGAFAKGKVATRHQGNRYFIEVVKSRLGEWKQTGSSSNKKKALVTKMRLQDFRGYHFVKHLGGSGKNAKFSIMGKGEVEKRISTALQNQKGHSTISMVRDEAGQKRTLRKSPDSPRKKTKVIKGENEAKSVAIKHEAAPMPVESNEEPNQHGIIDLSQGISSDDATDDDGTIRHEESKELRNVRAVFVSLGSPDVQVVKEAFKVLGDLLDDSAPITEEVSNLVKEGVVLFNSVQALQTHKNCVSVVQQILCMFLMLHERFEITGYWDMLFGALNGLLLSAVNDAMKSHPHDFQTHRYGLKCFRRMVKARPLISDEAVALIVETTIESMNCFEKVEKIQQYACGLLKTLAERNDAGCKIVKDAKALTHLASVSVNFPETRQAKDANATIRKIIE